MEQAQTSRDPSPKNEPISPSKSVRFANQPEVQIIEPRRTKMDDRHYERYKGVSVTNAMLGEAAAFFTENYGVLTARAESVRLGVAEAGDPVKLDGPQLRDDYLPFPAICSYAKVTVDGIFAGYATACKWYCNDKKVLWISQLVVHRDYRKRGLATGLLVRLAEDDVDIYGIASSHPAACLAAVRAFGGVGASPKLSFIKENAQMILESSPIRYIYEGELKGSLFELDGGSGIVSCIDTEFFVDHREALEALACLREEMRWSLGNLHEGFEFLLILEPRRHRAVDRSKSRSTSRSRSASESGPVPDAVSGAASGGTSEALID